MRFLIIDSYTFIAFCRKSRLANASEKWHSNNENGNFLLDSQMKPFSHEKEEKVFSQQIEKQENCFCHKS